MYIVLESKNALCNYYKPWYCNLHLGFIQNNNAICNL